jgi:N-acyl-D-amino-acid deacylase
MKRFLPIFVLLTILIYGVFQELDSSVSYDYDLAIKGGTLYLGGKTMGGVGDIAVKDDKIVAVGNVSGTARKEIDASGMIVSPGFIDLHTHSDAPFKYPIPMPGSVKANMNYITQGVTTVVAGNCGYGVSKKEDIKKWLDKIDSMPFGSNLIHLVPHGDIRFAAMGEAQADREDPRPTPEELEKMKELLRQGLEAGAWGLSTGLEYDPGARSDTKELIELSKVVAEFGGVYTTHMRHEGPDPEQYIASFAEAIAVGTHSGAAVQISHIKSAGKGVHGMSGKVIAMVEEARQKGVKIHADQYPYPAGSTTLSYMVPVEYRDGNKVLDRYCTEEGRKIIRSGVINNLETQFSPEQVLISLYPWKPWLQGKTLAEISSDRGEDPTDVAIDLSCGMIGMGIYFSMTDEDINNFMKQDWVTTGSDGSVFIKALGFAHPRFYGTFPRKIRRYVYEQKVITLGEALYSMTELPAHSFNIPKRGSLKKDYYADIVVFNPKTIQDFATFEKPTQYSEGIEHLVVNGTLTIKDGKYTGKRGGRALRLGRE